MSDEQTCGKGLADNAVLPAKLAELIDSQAAVLEHHMSSLDRAEPPGRAEYDAYASLVTQHRQIGRLLAQTAENMMASRDLPMAGHNIDALSNAIAVTVFQKFVQREEELAAMLKRHVEAHLVMLQSMNTANRPTGI
jgi:hypothetical protein